MPAPRLSASFPETPRYYARGLVRELMTKDVFLWAQAIAFKVLVTIVPVLVLATGVVGQVLRRDRPFEVVGAFVREWLPPSQSAQFLGFLRELGSASGTITLVGAVGLMLSAVTLMTTLRVVISNVFREDYHKARSIPAGYLFDLRMVGQVGLLFVATFALTFTITTLGSVGENTLVWLGLDAVWLRSGWQTIIRVAGLLVPFLLSVAMFAQLFYFVPTPRPPKKSVLRGALFTAVLWEAAKYGFAVYATRVANFDLGSSFGVVLALVAWVYYSGLVLCLGAVVVLLSEKRRRAEAGLGVHPPARPMAEPDAPRFAPAPIA